MNREIDESLLDSDLLKLFQGSRPLTKKETEHLAKAGEALDDDPQFRADYLKSLFVSRILEAVEQKGISSSELARRWGKSRQYVSRILDEDQRVNFTIESMTELAALVGRRLDLVVLNPNEHTHVLRCKVPSRTVGRISSHSIEKVRDRLPANVCSMEFRPLSTFAKNSDYDPCLSA